MRGVTMEKIDWKNLSYDDFTGFVAVTAILLFVLYFGGLWYTTYDYRIQMRDQMVEMYQQLPNPIPPIEDDYGVHQRWLVFYIDGVKVLNKPQPENVINEYKKALEKEGWATEREYEHVRNDKNKNEHVRNDKNKIYGINMRKDEFILTVSARENRDSINIHLIKRDWIYNKGF